ncbi:MAG: hypothetical protein JWM10_2734 [Myxococcaceae bacterium]|nr:hypothetical protein [Myxococcaceae bacterium]
MKESMATRRGLKSVAAVLAFAVALEACGAHVQLAPTPDRTAPLPTRVGAYNALRPTATQTTQHIAVNRYGQVLSASTSLDFIMFANGTQVAYPEDLVPLVDANSVTAVAANQSAEARTTGRWLQAGGGLGMLLGSLLLIPAIPAATGTTDRFTGVSDGDSTLLYTSIGLLTVGMVVYFVGQLGFLSTAGSERVRAFSTYDNSLRERLGLCGDGSQMGDCVNAGGPAGYAPGAYGAPPPIQ